MESVYNSLQGLEERLVLLEPHRRFVREGVVSRIQSNSTDSFHVFLFNDMLLWTKQKKSNYVVKLVENLLSMQVRDSPDTGGFKSNTTLISVDNRPAITVLTSDKTYQISFASREEKNVWMLDLSVEIANVLGKFGGKSIF